MMNRLMKGIAVLMAVCGFAGAVCAETAMYNGMPIEYTGATTNWVGGDLVLSFTVDGSLKLPVQATADVLVVGGGGSGCGSKQDKQYGDSGSGGQVTVKDGVSLSAGVYTIGVGAGGASAKNNTGTTGYDSLITLGGEELYKALGGAGGTGTASNAGSPESGTQSSITGVVITYGTGAPAASSASQSAPGVNPGDGGQGSTKNANSGAGANGVVIVRIKVMERPTFTFQGQTIEYFGAEIVSQSDDGVLLKYTPGLGLIDLPKMALADYLVVGGGGSGGTTKDNDKFGVSGNGGEVKAGSYASFQPGAYTIMVGAGGDAQTTQKVYGNDGKPSSVTGPTSVTAAGGAGGKGGDGNFAAAGSPIPGTTSSISGSETVYGQGGEKTTSKDAIYGGDPNTGNGGMGGNGTRSGAGGSGVVYLYIHSLKDYVECDGVTMKTGHSVTIPGDTRWGSEWTLRTVDATIAAATAAGSDVSVLGKKPGETTVMIENATTVYAYTVTVTSAGNPVAHIGDVYYESLADAVAAAKDGETVELLGNVTLTDDLTIAKNVTIAASNGTVAIARGSADANLILAGDVTFSNVTLGGANEPESYTGPMVEIARGGSMDLADGATLTQPKLTLHGHDVSFTGAEVSSASDAEGMLLKYADTAGGYLTLSSFALVDYLIVGGGGSGGKGKDGNSFGASGNGGQVVEGTGGAQTFPVGTYTIRVGAGGAAQTVQKTSGNAGSPSSISGTGIETITAAGGQGGQGGDGNFAAAGTPIPGTTSRITGVETVYGQGGEVASSDSSGHDAAANTGNGGQGGTGDKNSVSGAGGSGIVYVRVRALKEPVTCDPVTTEVTESVTIPHDTRWGDSWTVFTGDPALASATASGSDVTVKGLALGATKVMVMNETQIFIYDLTVTKLLRTKDVFVSTLDAETLLGEIAGEVESITVGSDAVVSTVLRDGKLYAVPGTGGKTAVTVETALAKYVYNVTVDRVINKTVELLKGATSGSSYSYEFDSIREIVGDGNGVITIAQVGNKVIFTAVQPGTASVQVYGAVDGGQDSVLNYTVVVKETSGEIATIDGVPVVYTGAAEAKKVGDDLVLVYTNTANVGTFEIPVPYMATVNILAVGGGGGGGSTLTFGDGAGGGGAGGVSEVDGKKFSGGIYTIKVGKGGAAGDSGTFAAPAVGSNGGDSFITNAVGYAYASAKGGGGGGAGANPAVAGGQNGGSGGGSVWYNGICGTPGRGISGQGAAGGAPSVNGQGGGGGGAGSVGGADRMGGKGETNDITGVSIVYAQGGMGGLDDTQKLADEVSGPGFGGNGGNGGPGSSGANGVVIVRITDIIRNVKVPIPTTNDVFRTGFVWEAGKTYSGLVYDDTTTFRSSTDAHPYRWIDAIDKVEGVTSTNCLFSAEGTKLGIGYHNFKITLKPGFSWEDDGGQDSYGTMGALSCRWTVRDADTVDLAAIDVTKSVTWTDSSNATISITTFTTPESAGARRDGVLVLGSLCFSHGFYSNIYDRALSAIAEVSDADYHWWYAEPPYQPGKNASYMQGNTNENGTAISGHLTKGEPYVYPWGSVGNSHDTGGQHETLFYFLDMLDKVRLAEQSGGKKYGYIVFSFDSDALAYGDYVQDQIAALKEVALRDGDTERYALYDAINPKSKTVVHPHVQEIAEWLAENFYKEGSVIWLDATNGSFSPSGDLMPILNPYSYLRGVAHSQTSGLPDQEYWTVVTTNNKGQVSAVYNQYQNQTYYGDADEVAKLLKSKIKVKPYNMELTDKIVSPEKGLTITSMTVQACTNGVDNVASTNETDWIDLLAWDRASGKGVFLPTSLEEGLGIPGASLEVDIVSNTTRTVVSNVDFKVWTRVKINVLDDGKFRTSTDATFNEMTGKWEKNPNEGKAYAEMIDPNGGISMHVDGDAETQVPWTFEAYPVTAIVHNGQAFVGGEDQLEQSIGEGGSCSVYYRGNGGYRIAKIIVDNTDVYEGAALVDYDYSYTFNNIVSPHTIEIFYEPFFGTVESAPVTNVYDNAVHLFDVKREGWVESISNEVRYALWKDREDSTKYYTAEEFKKIYEAEYGTDYNPDELTDVGDHEIAYRVFALQKGYGKTFTEEGWVWVESETWEAVGEGCGVDHSVIMPAPLTVRPESHKTIGAEDELPKIGIDIKGLIDGETLEDVIGHDATNSWSVTSDYKVPMGEGLYPTWVIDGEGKKLVVGDPSMITPNASTVDGNVGNYYLLPTDNFIPVVKIPIEIGGVPQGPGLDPEQPSMNTGVDPVIKPYDGVETGLVVEVTSEWPAGSDREGQPLVEGTDYTITWAIGNLDDPSTPPASGINDPNEPMFLHAGTNVVWYYVQTTPTSEADGLYFAASNYNYVIITPIPLVLESPSKTWRYTGETFSFDEVKVVDGTKLVDGDTLDAHTTASIKDVGSVTNVFNYKIVTGHPDAEHPNGNGDYDVTVRYGELIVTPTNITIGEKDYPLDPSEKVKYGDTGVEDAIRVYDGIPTNIVVDVKVPEEGKYEIRYCWSTNGVDKTEWSTELPLFTNVVDAVVYFEVTPIGNYINDYVPASGFARVIVTPAEVTVKADDKYIAVGDPLPEYTAVAGKVVPGNVIGYDTPASPTYEGTKGEYPIQVTGEEIQGNYHVNYEPGTLYVIDLGVALWIVDHEERDDGRCYLAFEPQIKEGQNFLAWLRYARDRGHVYVKYGRTWKECDECKPIRAFAREHRKETGAYHRDCGDGERDAAKGWMWIQVDLPRTTVLPLGYWRVYIDEPEISFTYGGKVKTVYVDDATGEPIPGVEPERGRAAKGTTVTARPKDIPGWVCVKEPDVKEVTIETDQEHVFTYRYKKATSL